MEVKRLPRNYAGGFERIPNQAIYNQRLSLAALGLLARLLADGTRFSSLEEIADHYAPVVEAEKKVPRGFGRDAYLKAARELSAAGYLARITQSLGRGVIKTTITVSAVSTPPQAVSEATSGNAASAQVDSETASGVAEGFSTTSQAVSDATSENATPPLVTGISSTPPEAVSDMNSGNDVFDQVISETAWGGLMHTDLFTDANPLLTSPGHAATIAASKSGEEEGIAQDKHTDAAWLLDRIDFARPLGGGERDRVAVLLSDRLHNGWPRTDLLAAVDGRWGGVQDRVAIVCHRVYKLGDAPRPKVAQPRGYCPVHPGTLVADCGLCATERAAAYDPEGGDGPIDYQAARAALRGRT